MVLSLTDQVTYNTVVILKIFPVKYKCSKIEESPRVLICLMH